ncbi:tektin-3 [Contarinia nasturtii]|uniref:tektin-3 n=1 Tax=Contarinia nasturtii TaxID=265458 RepID=UPI0012D37F87|nr:tektin-3 [Contarinia nasturtii]
MFGEKCVHTENPQMLTDQVIKQSELVIDTTRAKTDQCKKETEYRLKERLKNIQFLTEEISCKKKEVTIEEEMVKSYCKRLINAIKFIRDILEKNQKQYTILSEDCHKVPKNNDHVLRELTYERAALQASYEKLDTVLMRLIEKSRLLRTVIHALDSELMRKSTSLEIDRNNLDLRTKFTAMDFDLEKRMQSDPVVTTQDEWEHLTHTLLQNSSNEVASSKQLRSFTEISLSRTFEDISKQVNRTTEQFCKRIGDTTYSKCALEEQQNQTQLKINDIKKNLINLQTELEAKEKFLVLCKNRLENRALRPGTELCKDRVHETLVNELHTLQETIHHLQHMIKKSIETQRHLFQTKFKQDEDMGLLTHRLQIDDVDCMTIRNSIEFTTF